MTTDSLKCQYDTHCIAFEYYRANRIKYALKILGVKIENNYAFRKKLKKIIYLLEVVGIDLGFRFNWYLCGPYDIHLTDMVYNR